MASGCIQLPRAKAAHKSQCFFCQHPGLKANFEQKGSKCHFCLVDRNGYQLTANTPIVVDVGEHPELATHDLYVDYPLTNGYIKWVCRSCGLQDCALEDLLSSDHVFSRAPFLRMRACLAKHLEIRRHTQQLQDYVACSSSEHLA